MYEQLLKAQGWYIRESDELSLEIFPNKHNDDDSYVNAFACSYEYGCNEAGWNNDEPAVVYFFEPTTLEEACLHILMDQGLGTVLQ